MRISEHKLAADTPVETVYYKCKGNKKGPAVMITAGIHGKELGGIQGAQKLVQLLKNGKIVVKKGKLLIVPVANIPAFKRRIRGVPDLNRAFPRSSNGTARTALAKSLFALAKNNKISWLIDMHEAGGFSKIDRSKLGQSVLTNRNSASLPALRRVVKGINKTIKPDARHFTIKLRETPGTNRYAAARLLSARAITVETSMRLSLAARQQFHVNMARGLLHEAGVI